MICRKCGKEIANDSVNCNFCGAPASPQTNTDGYDYVHRPFYQNPQEYNRDDISPLSMGEYLKMLLLMFIPVLNFILLFIWSFSADTNVNKRNFARAYLIVTLINLILLTIIYGSAIGTLFTMINTPTSFA